MNFTKNFFVFLFLFHNVMAQSSLLGMTGGGGIGQGTIFKTDQNGNNHIILYEQFLPFGNLPGTIPVGSLLQANNGKLYGMTSHGGMHGTGVIFEFDIYTNKYIKKIDLSMSIGAHPKGSLIEAFNGKLYGMTHLGGSNNKGVIFEYDYISNIYTKKLDFSNELGVLPEGSLIKGNNGKLYGMTSGNSGGIIFEYDYINNIYIKKNQLSAIDASFPSGSLLQANNENLYGMTWSGGRIGLGVLFEYNYITNILKKLVDFDNVNGARPNGSLIQAKNGFIYGMTKEGGINNEGVIFTYDIEKNQYAKLIDLKKEIGTNPTGTLLQASNGKLYGTTQGGGEGPLILGGGVLFEYEIETNSYLKKISFTGRNGQIPTGGLIEVKVPLKSKDHPITELSIKLSPIPATNYVSVESNFTINNIQILDIIQNILIEQKWVESEKNIINLELFPSGLYIVNFLNSNNVVIASEKLVVQNK